MQSDGMDFKFQRIRSTAIPESKMISELERVAEHYHYTEFGRRDFCKVAEIGDGPVCRHFGSWKNTLVVLKKHLQTRGLELRQRKRYNEIPESKIILELEKTAAHFKYIEFGRRDFNKLSDISEACVTRHYRGWKNALVALRKHLQAKGLELHPRPFSPCRVYSDKELFDEMERIWQKVGQRPSRRDWELSEPKISYISYGRRFGGWTNACLKFIEYKMGSLILSDYDTPVNIEALARTKSVNSPSPEGISAQPSNAESSHPVHHLLSSNSELSRSISVALRLKVLDRDNFRCRFCGRSPATEIGVRLHIDHILPFSKGGKSELGNLQTLCQDCNLGKSDKPIGTRQN